MGEGGETPAVEDSMETKKKGDRDFSETSVMLRRRRRRKIAFLGHAIVTQLRHILTAVLWHN